MCCCCFFFALLFATNSPFLGNCVGLRTYKSFLLFVTYSWLSCALAVHVVLREGPQTATSVVALLFAGLAIPVLSVLLAAHCFLATVGKDQRASYLRRSAAKECGVLILGCIDRQDTFADVPFLLLFF